MNLNKEKKTAIRAARESAKIIRKNISCAQSPQIKNDSSFVTKADVNSQDIIIDILHASFPEDFFICEESETKCICHDRIWIIDPLDGTANYVKGIPFVAVNISLWIFGSPAISVTYDVFQDDYVCRVGSFPVEMHVKNRFTHLSEMIIIDNISSDKNRVSIAEKARLAYAQMFPIRSFGSAAIGIMYVLLGRASAYFAPNVHLWDIASGLHLIDGIENLRIMDLLGNPLDVKNLLTQPLENGIAIVRDSLTNCFWGNK